MKKILVVDDNVDILELVEMVLKSQGFEVLVSPTPENILANTETFSPQVILLDVFLSGYDGREVCRKLKNNPKTKDIPVIMFSAHTKHDEIIRECNADDFIAKPFEINQLIEKIKFNLTTHNRSN